MKFRTKLTLPDYRAAVYFSMAFRLRSYIRTLLIIIAAAALYLIAAKLGIISYSFLLNYIATAYLVFLLVQFGRVELAIYRYCKNPDCLIGLDVIYSFYETEFTVEIPERKEKSTYPLSSVVQAFEEGLNFMFFMGSSLVLIVPKTPLTTAEITALRSYLKEKLGDGFLTKRGEKKTRLLNNKMS